MKLNGRHMISGRREIAVSVIQDSRHSVAVTGDQWHVGRGEIPIESQFQVVKNLGTVIDRPGVG